MKEMGNQWVQDLAPLATDWKKEYLELAPYLIVVFKQAYYYFFLFKKKKNPNFSIFKKNK